jgi:hypothetical protein
MILKMNLVTVYGASFFFFKQILQTTPNPHTKFVLDTKMFSCLKLREIFS